MQSSDCIFSFDKSIPVAIIEAQRKRKDKMSAFLMSEESTSDLAYNIFDKGSCYPLLADYFEKKDITCPEDLFKELRKLNIKSVNERYEDSKLTKNDIGEYRFRKNELELPELVKKIQCWRYQSGCSEKVLKGKLYKALEEFIRDAAFKYLTMTEEYRNAPWE